MENPKHIGDGVYAFFDGYSIHLSVGDHRNPPVVILDPEVMEALVAFNEEAKKEE